MRLHIAGRSHIFRPLAARASVFFVSITLVQIILVNAVRREIDVRLADVAAQQSGQLDWFVEGIVEYLPETGGRNISDGQNGKTAGLKNKGASGGLAGRRAARESGGDGQDTREKGGIF